MVPVLRGGVEVRRETTREGSWTGSGRSSTAFITLKTAVLAPMPRASVSTQTSVKAGVFLSWRIEYRKSLRRILASANKLQYAAEQLWFQTPSALFSARYFSIQTAGRSNPGSFVRIRTGRRACSKLQRARVVASKVTRCKQKN